MAENYNESELTRLPRRRFIKTLAGGVGLATVGSLLSACGNDTTPANPAAGASTTGPTTGSVTTTTASQPTTAPPVISKNAVTLTVMARANEFTPERIKAFMDANPNIKVERVDDDATRFKAMLAAGTPPDLFRTQGPLVPNLVIRDILLDLTPYFGSSGVLKVDDLAVVNNYYVYNNKRYGIAQDWSPDFSLYVSNAAFEDSGVSMPSTTLPLTYTELQELGRKLTKRQGDRVLRMGYAYENSWFSRTLQGMLAQTDQKLYKPDNSGVVITGNPKAVEALRFYYDLSKANATWSPINPDPSWIGDDFVKGQTAIVQYGYWFTGYVGAEKDAVVKDKVTMLPAPVWTAGGKRFNACVTGTGYVVSKATKNPDAAWKLFEYYMGGEPTLQNAKTGSGIPSLKSRLGLLPKSTPFEQQVQNVLQDDLKYSEYTLDVNPYYDDTVFNKSWTTNLELTLRSSISFEQLVTNLESEVNTAIQEGYNKLHK